MISAAIVGGTGYTGIELIRLLSAHPKVSIDLLTSRSEAGTRADEIFPSLRGISDIVFSDLGEDTLAALQKCDVVFFATPHGVAMQQAEALTASGIKVVDLAADFRLQSLAEFEKWYKQSHACPDLLKSAVYGLPEINRDKLADAMLVGNPGCYPTTAILGLKPIIALQNQQNERLIESRIVIDAKSGVSGAGRQASLALNYAETTDNFKAYGVTGHRHLPEIEQGVEQLLASQFTQRIRFLPHLVPMIRGMFSSIHLELTESGAAIDWQQEFESSYNGEAFIDVLPTGVYPDTRSVRASNRLRIAIYQDNERRELTVLVVQDNLVKGAAGQAVQNMNVMFGFEESMGLNAAPIVP
ncbi:MAG: N-acetyl-gamma-glutamyl-phosphate reductase [Psychrobacter sp.]|jgi:N-acetyl-gamma-glutamyl-phosphate reductase|uniref:N-acetyl-gamma-glutamyl-phosphate reductase n=1 Tax=Psychrobacter TaxID=497 RepID=UPI00191B27AE|nr:N-acetyl-gamma-glutamyl-phosphate reductase [Psychrobacter sp. Ps3]MCG3882771.1 N-acetyl-gamma-glutamyl-phosphate reductase [Psychrobacter sp. Ps3]